MENLQAQIEKLTIEHNFKQEIKNLLGDQFKYICYISNFSKRIEKRIKIDCKDKTEFKKAFVLFPATNEETIIKASKEYYLNTPFRMNLKNPAKYNDFTLNIEYISNDYFITLTIPTNEIKEFINTSNRNITDCEYHYFTGWSHNKLRNTKILAYKFKSYDVIGWFGGDQTLLNEIEIEEIINYLNN